MFLRMVSHKIRTNDSIEITSAYRSEIITRLKGQRGCAFVSLLQNISNQKECVSLTIWNSKAEAEEYERSGVFKQLFALLIPYFEESTEFAFTLSEDLSIEYSPVPIEPNVTGYDEEESKKENIKLLHSTPYAVQIIRLSIPQEHYPQFEETFSSAITPKFRQQKGFMHLILLKHHADCTIISFWDESVDFSEFSVQAIEEFTREIVSFLPDDVQWRIVKKQSRLSTVSSSDIQASMYRCLVGEWL